ncbi:MAG: hypothetical protein JSR34_07290 [Proteobacteria bacterium]|nr:hypothetical protein [Pseudomonadota bacterium]
MKAPVATFPHPPRLRRVGLSRRERRFFLPPLGEDARLRRQDAGANGEAGPQGAPQERRVKADEGVNLDCDRASNENIAIAGKDEGASLLQVDRNAIGKDST